MKRLLGALMGLSLLVGSATVAFSQEEKKEPKKEEKKKKKKEPKKEG
jgi:hypothetical protein